jgi:F0F1-type ATP synthase membrane subunit b/b'
MTDVEQPQSGPQYRSSLPDGMGSDHPDTETLLRRVNDIISGAKSMPLSSSVMISKDEVLELLEEATTRLPDELRQARWLLREREEFLAKVQAEADDILAAARARAERMVQRTEIVREAKLVARNTVQDARDVANRLKHEAEDYCDQKLASFEIVLERTIKTVVAGREKLRITPLPAAEDAPLAGAEDSGQHEAFFDQDEV